MVSKVFAVAAALLVSSYATAAAPWLHVRESVTIQASTGKVWKAVKDFDALNTWHPAVAKDDIVEGTSNTVGAVRLLTLQNGGTIKEKLLAFSEAGHKYRYAILEGVLPVSDYTAVLTVSAGKRNATVIWSARFHRKNTGANPADNENDKAGVDAITGVFKAGLDNLKKMMEGGA